MVIYQKGSAPFILRFLPVFISPATWILSGFGAGLFYLAGTEKPPMSYGMYFVAGLVALLVYSIVRSHWVETSTKLVLIEIIPSGLRIQQVKYDTVHEVIIEAAQLDLAAFRYRYTRRNSNTQCSLTISDKEETHSFTVEGDEELIGQMLEKISEQKTIELRANENDFLKRYQKYKNSLGAKVSNVVWYGIQVAVVVVICIAGYAAYQNYAEGGYISELVKAIHAYQNDEPYVENNGDRDQLFAEFPKKWFPLFESDGGLVRQQLCGSETYIEIIERDGMRLWIEQGYQDRWETTIFDFARDGESKYVFAIQLENDTTRQVTILISDKDNKIYTIDDKYYTPSPESFVIKNDTEECL